MRGGEPVGEAGEEGYGGAAGDGRQEDGEDLMAEAEFVGEHGVVAGEAVGVGDADPDLFVHWAASGWLR